MREEIIGRARLILGDCREVLPTLGRVSHIITDPPYSARTHSAQRFTADTRYGMERTPLSYRALTHMEAQDIARLFAAIADGWIVWITDHHLAPSVEAGLSTAGRYTFAPLPLFTPGRSVRLTGDGPSSWTDWIVVSRTKSQSKWGTLPGGYVSGQGRNDKVYIGGKPLGAMRAIVSDYTRPDETVVDPFLGGGTTGVAAILEGRDFIGIEIDPAAFDIACRRIEEAQKQADLFIEAPKPKPVQQSLLGDPA